MEKEEILDQPVDIKKKKAPFRFIFYAASVLLILRFLFERMYWPYADWLLITSGILYVLFSVLRLIYHRKKSLFQIYSYVFFILVIPGLIMDYMYWPGARIFLNVAALIPLSFFIHLGISNRNRKKKLESK